MRVLPLAILMGCGATTAAVSDLEDTGIDLPAEDTDNTTDTGDSTDDPTTVPLPEFDCYAIIRTDEYSDGIIEETQVQAYNEAMLSIHQEFHNGDYGPWPREITDLIRDADGNPIEETFDEMGDGIIDYRIIRIFDIDGNLIESTTDYDDDGFLEERTLFTYYNGLLLEITQDIGDDGSIDGRVFYSYDADDRVVAAETDIGDDGSIDGITTYTYLLPAPSIDAFIEVDSNNDGYLEEAYEVTYTSDEEILTYAWDEDGDGEPNYFYSFTYDVDGLLETLDGWVSYEYPPYGLIEYDFLIEYAYDGDRQISAYTEAFFDGANNAGWWSDEVWDWTCSF